MGPLPWQVAYGHWIGWAAGATLVVLGAVLLWLWVRWLARRRGRALLANLGPGTTDITEGIVVLRGRLEVPGAPVPALDGSGAAAACTVEASREALRFAPHDSGAHKCFRAPSLRIVTSDGEASIRGEVRVIHGSRETFPGRLTNLDDDDRQRLTLAPDRTVSFGSAHWPKKLRIPGMLRTIRHSDEVLVRGLLRRNLGDGGPGASYRPMGTAFELVPTDGSKGVELAATAPAVLRFGKTALLVRGLAVGAVVSLTVCVLFGLSARRVDDFATAALFPIHRTWAIDALAQQQASGPPSEQRLSTLLAYEPVQSDCRRTGDALFEHGRWQRAGDVLSGCGDDASKLRAVAAYRLAGALEQASATLEKLGSVPADTDAAMVLLLGGRTGSAAASLRGAAALAPGDSEAASRLSCLADGIEARGGDEAARKRLATRESETCRLIHADLLEGEERLEALAYLADAPASMAENHRHLFLRNVLAANAGGEVHAVPLPALPSPTALLADPSTAWTGRAHGLEHETLLALAALKEPTAEQRALRTVLAIRSAAFETIAGNYQDASRLLDVAHADLTASPNALGRAGAPQHAWVEQKRAEAQIVTLRTLTLLFEDDVDGAASVLAPWRELTPSHFLDDHAPVDTIAEGLGRIRTEVVHPIEDALALVAAAQDPGPDARPVGAPSVIGLLAASTDSAALLGLDELKGSEVMPLLRGSPQLGLALVALTGHRMTANPAIVNWLRYEAAPPTAHPLSAMWHASLSARGARLLNASALADRRGRTAHAYRNALLQRQAALLFAFLPAE